MLNKIFLRNIFTKFVAYEITLHLVPFALKLVSYLSHAEFLNIREKSSLAQNGDFWGVWKKLSAARIILQFGRNRYQKKPYFNDQQAGNDSVST